MGVIVFLVDVVLRHVKDEDAIRKIVEEVNRMQTGVGPKLLPPGETKA